MKKLLLALLILAGCSRPRPELHVFNWDSYFAKDTIADFEKEFGCRVVLDYIESSDALRSKLQRPPSGYDVVFPSDELVPELIAGGYLEKLDLSKISNFKNLKDKFRGLSYDSKNEFSVPYMWGTTGIAYNKKKVDPAPDSWAALWDPKYARRVSLLDDAREAMAAGIWLEGASPTAPSAELIDKAKKRLQDLQLLAFESSPKMKLIQGDVWMAQCFNGDAVQAAREADIGYVIPKEGGTIWVDNIGIAKGASQVDLAHRFINYLLRPEVSAAISNAVQYANPNEAAQRLIDPKVLGNPLVNPPESETKRCSLFKELAPGLKKKLNDAWAEVKGR